MTEERSARRAADAGDAQPEEAQDAQAPVRAGAGGLAPRELLLDRMRGRHAQVDPVEVARAERDGDAKRLRKQREAERNQARQERQRQEQRVALLERAATWLVLGVVMLAPVAIGAVHLVALLPLTLMASAAAGLAWWSARVTGRPFRASAAGWALLGLSAVTFCQAIPLPLGVLSGLSGQVGAWWQDAWGASVGGVPATGTLSLHPGEAARMGFVWWTAAALYLAVYNLFREKERFQRLLLVLPATGALLVLIGVVQKAAGISARLFFYEPRQLEAAPFFASTFVNPNHLGTLLGLISFVPLGMSLSQEYRNARGGLVALFVICAAGMVMTLSVTALVAWLVGMAAFGLLILRRRLSDKRGLTYISVGAVFAVGLGAYAAWSQIAERAAFLARHQGVSWLMPTEIWRLSWGLVTTSPVFGVGKGGFEDAFAALHPEGLTARVSYVSNTWLQAVIDYGVPVGAAVSAVFVFTVLRLGLRRGWKASDLPLMTALFAAFTFLGFEASVGFSLEIPGVLLPAIFALALADGRSARYRRGGDGQAEEAPAGAAAIALRHAPAVALGVAALLAVPTIPTAIDAIGGLPHERLRQAVTTPPVTVEAVNAAYRDALRHRPISGNVHLNAAIGFQAAGDEARSWEALQRARRFQPGSPAPRLLEARALVRQGKRAEALGSYRDALALAVKVQGPGADAIALEVARGWADPAQVAGALPVDPALWGRLLEALKGEPARALALARALRGLHPGQATVPTLWEARALAALERWEEALPLAEALLEEPPGLAGAYVIALEGRARRGQVVEAAEVAEKALRYHGFDTEVLFAVAEFTWRERGGLGFARDEKAWSARLDPLLQQLKPYVIKDPSLRHRYYKLAGLYHRDVGRLPTAITELRKCLEANPQDAEATFELAALLRHDHQNERAAELLRLFVTRFPDDPLSAEALVNLRELEAEIQTLQRFRQGRP